MGIDDNISLIVGDPQGILDQQLGPCYKNVPLMSYF
jgi:hypothetical protein